MTPSITSMANTGKNDQAQIQQHAFEHRHGTVRCPSGPFVSIARSTLALISPMTSCTASLPRAETPLVFRRDNFR